jgi:hypothetical protein
MIYGTQHQPVQCTVHSLVYHFWLQWLASLHIPLLYPEALDGPVAMEFSDGLLLARVTEVVTQVRGVTQLKDGVLGVVKQPKV